uniref:DNA polymerase subunit gamma-1 n=1 Tax=Hucho hucho TaxID=62062 RepID=A0A4W5KQM5_9TELE
TSYSTQQPHSLQGSHSSETRLNPLNIQILSQNLQEQIFRGGEQEYEKVKRSIRHLQRHQLWGKRSLCCLVNDYSYLTRTIYFEPEWIAVSLNRSIVLFPDRYSWSSKCLIEERYSWSSQLMPADLIPLETRTTLSTPPPPGGQRREKLIVDHNVSFDRSYIKEQYLLKGSKASFLDTMSLHMAISGLTGFQLTLWMANKHGKSSIHNLADVHALYVGGEPLQKGARKIFMKGSMADVRNNFQVNEVQPVLSNKDDWLFPNLIDLLFLKTTKQRTKQDTCLIRERLKEMVSSLPKWKQHLPGHPGAIVHSSRWYRKLCVKMSWKESWSLGASLISLAMWVTPKLTGQTWDGFPLVCGSPLLFHGATLVPGRRDNLLLYVAVTCRAIGSVYREYCEQKGKEQPRCLDNGLSDDLMLTDSSLWQTVKPCRTCTHTAMRRTVLSMASEPFLVASAPSVSQPWSLSTPNSTHFYCNPGQRLFWLQDGNDNNVGSPFSNDFLFKVEDGTLRAGRGGTNATRALEINKMISFWRNTQKHISSQKVVWLRKGELHRTVSRHEEYEDGHLPQVFTAGTVTCRAEEPMWLIASNAQRDRVGSELKAMVQVPPGYHLVGTDVDCQELWIATGLGEAHFTGMHGCTVFGWMTLQGKKSQGTDQYSHMVNTVGISREHAKVFNYRHINGAGQPFANRLQFNHRLSQPKATSKARQMYTLIKGLGRYRKDSGGSELGNTPVDLARNTHFHVLPHPLIIWACRKWEVVGQCLWAGGMFNKLEHIAHSAQPATPVPDFRVSRALEHQTVKDEVWRTYANTIIKAHKIIHNEVRYLVHSEDRYWAALALQITNLLTRSDMPQSVAFFSAVDIDQCRSKEVTMDWVTPSNPTGLECRYCLPQGEKTVIKKLTLNSLAKALWWTFLQAAWQMHAPCKLETSVALL